MPQTPHVEKHFTASETVRDIVIGMSDGLTVPFALAAGLSGAVEATGIIITAGLAEVAAGAIAMGLGGYLAARTDAEHYASELLVFAVACLCVRWIAARTKLQLLGVGLLWVVLTVLFEVGLGRPVLD